MNWISNLMIIVILTCATGSILTVMWMIFHYFFGSKINVQLLYKLLKCVMSGYLVPLTFLLLKGQEIVMGFSTGYLFLTTQTIQKYMVVLFIFWMSGFMVLLVKNIPQFIYMKKICNMCVKVPIEQEEMLQLLCRELKIHRKIRLYQGYPIGTPFVTGIVQSNIFLPMKNFSEQNLKMILTHELYHCKQGDVFWKPVFAFTCYMYWFNPFVWYIWRQMKRYAEVSCDDVCCEKCSPKEYFELLFGMNECAVKCVTDFAPMWCEDENEMKWRIKCMKNCTKKGVRRWGTAVTMATAICCTCFSAYAADLGVEKVYKELYEKTVTATLENVQPDEFNTEYTGTLDDFQGMEIIEKADNNNNARASVAIDWTIKDGYVVKSGEFYKSKGSEIYVAVVLEPTDKTVKVGIIQPDETTRYVYCKGSVSHTFEVTQSGNHRVFISNGSGTQVVATGAYTK